MRSGLDPSRTETSGLGLARARRSGLGSPRPGRPCQSLWGLADQVWTLQGLGQAWIFPEKLYVSCLCPLATGVGCCCSHVRVRLFSVWVSAHNPSPASAASMELVFKRAPREGLDLHWHRETKRVACFITDQCFSD